MNLYDVRKKFEVQILDVAKVLGHVPHPRCAHDGARIGVDKHSTTYTPFEGIFDSFLIPGTVSSYSTHVKGNSKDECDLRYSDQKSRVPRLNIAKSYAISLEVKLEYPSYLQ
jgi:hypothetical protein